MKSITSEEKRESSSGRYKKHQTSRDTNRSGPTSKIIVTITVILLILIIPRSLRLLKERSSNIQTFFKDNNGHDDNENYSVSLEEDEVLPTRYAICSSPRGSIFTSDSDLPFVECIAIDNRSITFLGSREELELFKKKSSSSDLKNHLQSSIIPLFKPFFMVFSRHFGFGKKIVEKFSSSSLLLSFEIEKDSIESFKVFELDGESSILPGLIDSHCHPLERGRSKTVVNLLNCDSIRCVIERIIENLNESDDDDDDGDFKDKIIFGDGWDQTLFEDKKFPTSDDLSTDPILRGLKIVLRRIDFHSYWVSNSILESIDKKILNGDDDKDLIGGEIVRRSDGSPTGIFIDNAMDLVREVLPKTTDEERMKYLRIVSEESLSLGLTTLNDAACDIDCLEFYKTLDRSGLLPLRIFVMVDCQNSFCGDLVEVYQSQMLTVRSAKLFIDGALGSWGASLWEPYSDKPDSKGILRISSTKELSDLINSWTKIGFQVNCHSIGDRSTSIIIEAYENVLLNNNNNNNNNGRRKGLGDGYINDSVRPNEKFKLRIEHLQVLRKSDLDRISNLGIFASVQPTHAILDMDYAEDRLGKDRIKDGGAYPLKSLFKKNVTMVFGSDFPVTEVNPFLGIHAALTRKKPIIKDDNDYDSNNNDNKNPEEEEEEEEEDSKKDRKVNSKIDRVEKHEVFLKNQKKLRRRRERGWYEGERLKDLKEIVKSFSIYSSLSSFNDHLIGSLEVGKLGDLIVVDQNIFLGDDCFQKFRLGLGCGVGKEDENDEIERDDDEDEDGIEDEDRSKDEKDEEEELEQKILKAKVKTTILDGRLVYGKLFHRTNKLKKTPNRK